MATTLTIAWPYGSGGSRIVSFDGTHGGGIFVDDMDVAWTVESGDGSAGNPYLISFETWLEAVNFEDEQCPPYSGFTCFVGVGSGMGTWLPGGAVEFCGTFTGVALSPSWLAAVFAPPGYSVNLRGTFDLLLVPAPAPWDPGQYEIYGALTYTDVPEPSTLVLIGPALIGGAGVLRRRFHR